jgi:digeranylgeranylglycerophospholipid reductase
MLLADTWDILVVGAGPAGSSAAAASAKEGARTLLIDSKQRIGEQPHCAEFVPRRLFTEFDLDRRVIVQSVGSMATCILHREFGDRLESTQGGSRSGQRVEHKGRVEKPLGPPLTCVRTTETISPGFLIDRVRFDRTLARCAVAMGATVLNSTRLVNRKNERWIVRCADREIPIKAGFVVAADGALSTVGRVVGFERPELLNGLQVHVPLTKPLDRTFVFLEKSIRGGYGWLFPKGSVANVGIGVAEGDDVHPNEILEQLLGHLLDVGMIQPGRLARGGGVIPVSGLRESLVHDTAVLCGDAAGLTHPITGAGIPQAVFSGTLAGQAAARAVKTGNAHSLFDYESQIRAHYGGVLRHAVAKRRLMMQCWNEPDFQSTCERTWIAFKGYSRRLRSGITEGVLSAACREA